MKYFLAILVAFGAYHWYSNNHGGASRFTGEAHDELIMYSLTTCGYCKQKAKELESEGIPYVEYYIDQDHNRRDELNEKLAKSGYPPKGYGTPIFDAYGHMLPNNPSLSKILSVKNSD